MAAGWHLYGGDDLHALQHCRDQRGRDPIIAEAAVANDMRYAIENGVGLVEMGATTYATKLLFGGYLERRWLYFRCRWRIATGVMRPFLRFADFERNDPELRKLNAIVHEQGETKRL